MKLTVFFEGEFWVGVTEDVRDGRLRAARHIFGAEPHDAEVMQFVLRDMMPWMDAISQTVAVKPLPDRPANPKSLTRRAAKEMECRGTSDTAKEALMKELEHRKKVRRVVTRKMREAEKERKREIAALKAKAKHRGR